jgi:outer membrane protein W
MKSNTLNHKRESRYIKKKNNQKVLKQNTTKEKQTQVKYPQFQSKKENLKCLTPALTLNFHTQDTHKISPKF